VIRSAQGCIRISSRSTTEDVPRSVNTNIKPQRFKILDKQIPYITVRFRQRKTMEAVVIRPADS